MNLYFSNPAAKTDSHGKERTLEGFNTLVNRTGDEVVLEVTVPTSSLCVTTHSLPAVATLARGLTRRSAIATGALTLLTLRSVCKVGLVPTAALAACFWALLKERHPEVRHFTAQRAP